MKKLWVFFFALALGAQTQIDLGHQVKNVIPTANLPTPSTMLTYLQVQFSNTFSHKYYGSGAPGNVTGNLAGDLYLDTSNSNVYSCLKPFGTAAPACTTVAAGSWVQINSGNSSVLSGTGVPSNAICISAGLVYINTTNSALYVCPYPTSSTWTPVYGPIANLSIIGNNSGVTAVPVGLPLAPGSTGSIFQNYGVYKFPTNNAPGTITGNEPLDIVVDSTHNTVYICGAVAGTPAPACTGVSLSSWIQLATLGGAETFSGPLTFSSTIALTGVTAGTLVSCLGLTNANLVATGTCGSGSGGYAGVNTQTASYLAVSGDNGKLITMTTGTLTMPTTAPSNWSIFVQNLGTAAVLISPNGNQWTGSTPSTSNLSLSPGAWVEILSNGANYSATPPFIAGAGVLISYTPLGITFSSDTSVNYSVTNAVNDSCGIITATGAAGTALSASAPCSFTTYAAYNNGQCFSLTVTDGNVQANSTLAINGLTPAHIVHMVSNVATAIPANYITQYYPVQICYAGNSNITAVFVTP